VRMSSSMPAPVIDRAMALSLTRRVCDLHIAAYGSGPVSNQLVSKVVDSWQSTVTRSPRLLVRMTIDLLDASFGNAAAAMER
jgi:hypothetical protein